MNCEIALWAKFILGLFSLFILYAGFKIGEINERIKNIDKWMDG